MGRKTGGGVKNPPNKKAMTKGLGKKGGKRPGELRVLGRKGGASSKRDSVGCAKIKIKNSKPRREKKNPGGRGGRKRYWLKERSQVGGGFGKRPENASSGSGGEKRKNNEKSKPNKKLKKLKKLNTHGENARAKPSFNLKKKGGAGGARKVLV